MNFHFFYRKGLPVFMAGILAVLSLNISNDTVSAAEITVSAQAEDIETELAETPPAALSTAPEEGDTANSFRYTNGKPIFTNLFTNNVYARASTSSTAWSKVNGVFVNDQGVAIPNAVEKGIDVSYHNGTINWAKVKASDVDFAIIRCGYGQDLTSQDDKCWFINADACTENGIPFGTYIYSYATSQTMAIGEANHVLRLIQGYDLQYPIYYDLEDASQSGFSATKLANMAKAFCSTIEAAGYKAAIYANKDWFTNKLTNAVFDDYDRWVAQYNSTCTFTKAYTMWQCTSSGSVSGVTGSVDINFVVQSDPLVPVTSLALSEESISMEDTDTATLDVDILPYNAFNKQVSYSSSDDTIASVDKNGVITAHQKGSVTITVKSEENSSVKATCTVTVSSVMEDATETPIVTETPIPMETPIVTKTPIPTETPIVTETPMPTKTPVVTETPIPTKTPVVTKTPIPTETPIVTETPVPTETITLNKTAITMVNGKTTTLLATTNSSNAVSWTSSDTSVATVTAKGKITAKTPGKAIITAAVTDTCSTSCVVYVKPVKTSNASFTAVTTKKLTLSWDEVSGADGYAIYRHDTATGEDVLIKSLSSSKTSYTFNKVNGTTGSALTAGGKYTFKIAAYITIDGENYYSPNYVIKTATKPKKTTVKTLKRVTSTSMKMTWSKISASDGYIIYISNSSTSGFKALATVSSSATTSYTATNLTKGKTYYVKICTYRKINGQIVYSNYSNTIKLKLT